MLTGILYVDKPAGWTSFDVVNYTRKIVARLEGRKPRNVKVGHTGTLDPAATGLLEICVGRATKEVTTRIKHDKTYAVTVTLGITSTTGDSEGELSISSDAKPSLSDVEEALSQFVGKQQQMPPQYSAIKVNGVPAYKLARAGKPVELQPREVEIYSISDIKYDYPDICFTARVSSGTYIRSLAEDLGKKLGTGAYMSGLRRTAIATVDIASALTIDELSDEILQKTLVEKP